MNYVYLIIRDYGPDGESVAAVAKDRAEAERLQKEVRGRTSADEVRIEQWSFGQIR